jgi:hypothetical protein
MHQLCNPRLYEYFNNIPDKILIISCFPLFSINYFLQLITIAKLHCDSETTLFFFVILDREAGPESILPAGNPLSFLRKQESRK